MSKTNVQSEDLYRSPKSYYVQNAKTYPDFCSLPAIRMITFDKFQWIFCETISMQFAY